jgi:hypothetical protein
MNRDSVLTGVITGMVIPLIVMSAIILVSSSKFESIGATIDHFVKFNLMYKILSLSIMPGAGLFLIWSKNKINQARGVLLATLFYGVFVILLYL